MLCTLADTDPKSCKYQGFIERKTSSLGGRIPCTQICSKAVPLIFFFLLLLFFFRTAESAPDPLDWRLCVWKSRDCV